MACPSFWLNLQVGPKESSWDQFRMSGISFDSAAGLGGQLRFLKETPTKSTKGSARPLAGLDEWQLAAKVQELVQKLFRVGAGMVGPRHPWRCSGMIGSSLHF
ncbi:unnamed protein product [Symbiodinium necroappetens]|uniref:Uncharacterized protein n=1 Tax=Symbiodinium necroappetens TaxID=1628268 RepID=A0A813C0A0_9DINO|nr:unnamed protein product [Symbiodinium microadriaticum]CAE7931257.1 unnamed protein product [Symbiodinium necroappetens]CAE7947879.1 unnamed protein product [Symbiodinium sp. KB8]